MRCDQCSRRLERLSRVADNQYARCMFGPLVDILRQVQKQCLFKMCRHAHANKTRAGESNEKVFLSGNYIGYSSVAVYFEATWNELFLNTRRHTRTHTRTTWRSTTSPSSKQQLYQHQISTAFLSGPNQGWWNQRVVFVLLHLKKWSQGLLLCVQKRKLIWKTSKKTGK